MALTVTLVQLHGSHVSYYVLFENEVLADGDIAGV